MHTQILPPQRHIFPVPFMKTQPLSMGFFVLHTYQIFNQCFPIYNFSLRDVFLRQAETHTHTHIYNIHFYRHESEGKSASNPVAQQQ